MCIFGIPNCLRFCAPFCQKALSNTLLSSLSLAVLVLQVAPLHAANVYWRPRVQLGAGYENNIRMVYDRPGEIKDSSALVQTQVDGELGADSGAERTTLFARYWTQSVIGEHVLDADIKQVRLSYANTQERSTFSSDIDAQHDTTLTSEFDTSGISPDEIKDRHYYHGSMDYRWFFSPRNYVTTNIGIEAVRYINAENTTLSSYDTTSYTTGFGHMLNERTRIGAQLSYSEFDIPKINGSSFSVDQSYETDNFIALLFTEYAISENDNVTLQAGLRSSNFYNSFGPYVQKEEGNGRVFNAVYKHQFEVSSLQITASRDLNPNGAGRVVEQDSVALTFASDISQRLSFNTVMSASRQREPLATQSDSGDRDFGQLLMELRYEATEKQSIALELSERWQQIKETNIQIGNTEIYEAEGAGVFLRWYWNPPQRSLH